MRQKLKNSFGELFFGFWCGFSVLRNKNNNKKSIKTNNQKPKIEETYILS
jgi:hypothetical protein